MTSQNTVETGSEVAGDALPAPSIRRKWYVLYCALVVIAMVAFKLWAARDIKASAMFADDYDYLNKSVYYLRGDLAMTGYPYANVQAGLLYPIVLSPWMLFHDPAVRMLVVHAINIILSGVTVYFGSRTVARLVERPSWLAPLCLASFGPVFLLSYYAMTENLLFALLAVMGWLVVDFEKTLRSRAGLAALLIVMALLPMVRAPGMAACAGLLALVWLNRKPFRRLRAASLALAIVLAAVGPYLIYAFASPPSSDTHTQRESVYLETVWRILGNPGDFKTAVVLALSQVRYLFLSTGYWALPMMLVMALQLRRLESGPAKKKWVNYLAFSGISGAVFVSFCMVHVIQKIKFDPTGAGFIYGRYNDPAALLLAVGGIAALSSLTIPTRVQGAILRVAAPLALCLVMASVHGIRWNPANQCGLAIFASYSKGRVPLDMFVLWAVVATLVSQLTPPSRFRVPAFLALFFAFNCMTVSHGMSYTRGRAHRAAHSLEAAAWIHENLPNSTRIGYDTAISRKGAPHGLKRMYNVYRAMMFATYPRPVTTVSSPARLRECDYFYTMAAAENPLALPLSWTNGDYTLYKVVPEAFDSDASGAER